MLRSTHKDGGKVSANITAIIYVLLIKLSHIPYYQQVVHILSMYIAIRYLSEMASVLPDSDLGLEQIPLRNPIGYLLNSYCRINNITHRAPPFHCLEFYHKTFIPPIALLCIIYVYTRNLIPLTVMTLLLSVYGGALSHVLLDALTLRGVYKTKTKHFTFATLEDSMKLWNIKWLGPIPLFYKKKIKIEAVNKRTGGDYEAITRSNVNLINGVVFKLLIIIAVTDFSILFNL